MKKMKETSQLKLGKSVVGNPVPAFVNVRLYNKMQNLRKIYVKKGSTVGYF